MTMLEVVLRQTAGDMIANGITEPTEALFHDYFLRRLNRNREICERFITDPQFHDTVTHEICAEVYAEIRKGKV